MIKKRKYLEISLQHDNEVKDAVKFNMENNYEYIISCDNNLVSYNNLAYLLRVGYELNIYADVPTFTHKSYNKDLEVVELKEV